MVKLFLCYNVLLLYLCCLQSVDCITDYKCLPDTDPIGVSLPRGDIFLQQNQSQNITCHLNPKYPYTPLDAFSSQNLVFKSKHGYLNSTAIDATSIVARYVGNEIDIDDVSCLIKKSEDVFVPICAQRIHVGYTPLPLQNFRQSWIINMKVNNNLLKYYNVEK